MCGICGILDYNSGSRIDEGVLRRMCSLMAHRGPDDEGLYISPRSSVGAGFGHRRLKIIDLSPAGHQPMANEDKSVWIVFNGEVYNYKDLREDLKKKGHKFLSGSDTETVIHLYEEYGERCVEYIRGMFAFAIWDERNGTLLAARDRPGKKPFLYYKDSERFCFASEFNALLASGLIEKNINPEALNYYLTFGYVPAPLTIYKNVFKLPAAHLLLLKNGNLTIKQYWKLDYSKKINISEPDAARETLILLKEAVKIRLYSDVPIGAFLSGGIDSSAVVALMSQLSERKVRTFSIGFQEKDYSELKYARNIAKRFGTEHIEFIVKPKAMEILPLLVERYGEPYADSSCIPTYYVCRETKQHVTVALNGDGGDELFAGYERYQAMLASEVYQKMPAISRRFLNRVADIIPDSVNSRNNLRRIKRFINGAALPCGQRYVKWVGVFSEALKEELYTEDFSKSVSDFEPLTLINQFLCSDNKIPLLDSLLFTDSMTYLPGDLLVKVDIASMANSLEARSPFLDHKLMEFAVSLPAEYKMRGCIKKFILKEAMKGILPKQNIHRKKMGFGVPIGEWLRNELKGFLQDTLLSASALNRGYFNSQALKSMVGQHIAKEKDYAFQLWSLLMLELWHQKFID